MRDIQQRTMSDEEKWLDDRKEANRLLAKGIIAIDGYLNRSISKTQLKSILHI